MIKTFLVSQKLKNTYKVNNILFSLKQIPLVKKILPISLYKNKGLKIFANIISIIIELFTIFFTKPLYLSAMILFPATLYDVDFTNNFLHILTFLTIAGTLLNCHFFHATKDKFYAICLLKMDAKKYILSNYFYFLFKITLGFLLACLLLGVMFDINLFICFLVPVFVACAKISVSAFLLLHSTKSKKIFNEDKPTPLRWTFILTCIALAYALPNFGIAINSTIFLVLTALSLILGIPSCIYIWRFANYTSIYKRLLTLSTVVFSLSATVTQTNKLASEKQIDTSIVDTKGKTGYAYFHELFVKRHRKILTRSGKNTAIFALVAVLSALIGVFISEDFAKTVNNFTLTFLPYCLYIMLIINRGQVVTKAMFMNCDHSMLSYRFYRQPSAILELFTKRLMTLISINLMPAIIIAIGLPILLYFSGGTDTIINYFVLFVSIISMAVFFSVHFLILYYLLQPYNIEASVKSSMYPIAIAITYLAVFVIFNFRLPTMSFGIFMIVFMLVYIPLAIGIAYKFAPRTFKLR